jgi:hypothetical protein
MTDRIHALTVALREDLRDDDAQVTIDAIRQLRAVVGVKSHVADLDAYAARSQFSNTTGLSIMRAVRAIIDGKQIPDDWK